MALSISLLFGFDFLLLPEPVDATVCVSLSTDKTAESKSVELASEDTIGIKMTNVKLNRGVIL